MPTCPSCRTFAGPGDRFCPACGTRLKTDAPPAGEGATPETGTAARSRLQLPPLPATERDDTLPAPDAPPVEVMDFGFVSARRRLRLFLGLLAAWAAVTLIAVLLEVSHVRLVHRLLGARATLGEVVASNDRIGRIGVAQAILFAAAALAWLSWQYRAQANLSFLRVRDVRNSPGAAAGWGSCRS